MSTLEKKKIWGSLFISALLIPSVLGSYPEFLNRTGNVIIGASGMYEMNSNGTVEKSLLSWSNVHNASGSLVQVSNGLETAWVVFYENNSVEAFHTKDEAKASVVSAQKGFLDRYIFMGGIAIIIVLVFVALVGEKNE